MAVNRVIYGDRELLDLTNDTVTPETLAEGVTAHDKSGEQIVGTMKAGVTDPVYPWTGVTPREYEQIITPPTGYGAFGYVKVYPIPRSYIIPEGTKTITENGLYDVHDKASVDVSVGVQDGYIKPSGTLNIFQNGTYDVTDKESVVVEVASQGGGDTIPMLTVRNNSSYPIIVGGFMCGPSTEKSVPGCDESGILSFVVLDETANAIYVEYIDKDDGELYYYSGFQEKGQNSPFIYGLTTDGNYAAVLIFSDV